MNKINFLVVGLAITVLFTACKKEGKGPGSAPPGDAQIILLKDIIIQGLPSPYYHFDYNDSGYITNSDFSSGLREYEINYSAKKISQINSTHAINRDRLLYQYENGKPSLVKYLNEGGEMYKRCFVSYNSAGHLNNLEWEVRQMNDGFALLRTVDFTYYPDGNLQQMRDERHPFAQQAHAVYIDNFSDYDNKLNVDGFSRFHYDGDHLLLFPSSKLQKNNPAKLVRTGTGINYEILYNYTYDNLGRPSLKSGTGLFTSGPGAGQAFQSTSSFTYYP
jgi:hypothetical protein